MIVRGRAWLFEVIRGRAWSFVVVRLLDLPMVCNYKVCFPPDDHLQL